MNYLKRIGVFFQNPNTMLLYYGLPFSLTELILLILREKTIVLGGMRLVKDNHDEGLRLVRSDNLIIIITDHDTSAMSVCVVYIIKVNSVFC